MTNLLKLTSAAVKTLGNSIALGMHDITAVQPDHVIQDERGVPTAWRIFAYGPIGLTQNGRTMRGVFTPEAADAIMDYYAIKGSRIPLDSDHYLFHLAQKLQVEESAVAKLLPDGNLTFAFGALEKRADGLWVTDVEYNELAYSLMAEGVFRYFSPVLRGLADGRLRITSLTFTNEPGTDMQDAIAASAAEEDAGTVPLVHIATGDAVGLSANRRSGMDKLLAALAALTGQDTLALTADGAAPDGIVETINELAGELTTLRTAQETHSAFLEGIRGPLALEADAPLSVAQGAILALVERAGQTDEMKQRLDTLVLESETRKKQEVIDRLQANGKLPDAMLEWANGQDSAALTAYEKVAQPIVPIDQINRGDLTERSDAVALTADQSKILSMVGVTDPEAQKAAVNS